MTKSETVSQPCDTTLLCHMAETVSDFVMFHLEEFALKPGFIFTVFRKQLKIFVYYCTILELFFKKWIKIICGVSEFFSNLPPTQTMRKRLLVTLFLIILAMTPCHPNNIKGKPRHQQYRPRYRSWSENI